MHNILFTIAARKGSKGLPDKNLLEISDMSLIERSINLARLSGLSKYLVISTDSDEIKKIAKKNGVEVWFKRPKRLSGDNVSKVDVIKHALEKADIFYKKKFDVVIDIDATAPLTKAEDVIGAYKLLVREKYDFVTTGCESRKNPYFNMVEFKDGKLNLVTSINKKIVSRQKAPKVYDLNAGVYVYTRKFLVDNLEMFSENQGLYIMPQNRSWDIDTKEDFEIVKSKIQSESHKNVLVIGGNGLIGSSVINNLSKKYNVINIDISNKKEYEYTNGIHHYKGDVLDIKSFKKLFNNICKNIGNIYAVVNCTHFKNKSWNKDLINISEEEFNKNIQNLLSSAFLVSQIAIDHFMKSGKGNLINLSSIQGIQPPKFWHYENTDMNSPIEYSLAKSSIISMTKYLAKYYKNKNIRINCVSPGGINDNQPNEFIKNYEASTLNIGMLDPEDISNTVEWLVSEQSRAINGQNIIVDDGWSL